MASYYHIDRSAILDYYNLIGVDKRDIELSSIETEGRYLEDILRGQEFTCLPQTSMFIEIALRNFYEHVCEDFGFSEEESVTKANYLNAVHSLLNDMMCLNVLPEGSEDYALLFNRTNTLLYLALEGINKLSTDVTIMSAAVMDSVKNQKDFLTTYKFLLAIKCNTLLPLLLTKISQADESLYDADYEIFKNDTSLIDVSKLVEKIENPGRIRPTNMKALGLVRRPSYRRCMELMEESKKN